MVFPIGSIRAGRSLPRSMLFEQIATSDSGSAKCRDRVDTNTAVEQCSARSTVAEPAAVGQAGGQQGRSGCSGDLDVEMETGTGKTYVYIKTIMELHKRYGWSPIHHRRPVGRDSRGVKKSIDLTAEHFQQTYGSKPRSFIYNSSQLHELGGSASDAFGVQVMIINIQAFNSTSKDNRRIYDELDDFQSRRPIDVISAKPSHRDHGRTAKDQCTKVAALCRGSMRSWCCATRQLTRSSTPRSTASTRSMRITRSWSKIAVRGITVKGLAGTTAYLYLDAIGSPRAQNRGPRGDRGTDQRWADRAPGQGLVVPRSMTSPGIEACRADSSPTRRQPRTSSNSATGCRHRWTSSRP